MGSELLGQLLTDPGFSPAEVIGIDNNETALFFLDQQYLHDSRANFFLCDIRDYNELRNKSRGVDIIFHAAALKHVILCERSPEQAVQTNINGVQNVIASAIANNVETVIFTSSDKAVNPTNVMGTSKLMGERLMTAANSSKLEGGPVFASTRFGNVLGSNGSVLPIFRNQILKGGPVTLTDREMTRFVMSIRESVQLIIDSAMYAMGGEVFITKMPVVRIEDLACAMVEELALDAGFDSCDIKIEEIGTKPGEKLYEELMSPEEVRRAVELPDYFSVLPAFRGIYSNISYDYPGVFPGEVNNPYVSSSEPAMTVEEIRCFLRTHGLLEAGRNDADSDQRYWPGDKEENS